MTLADCQGTFDSNIERPEQIYECYYFLVLGIRSM